MGTKMKSNVVWIRNKKYTGFKVNNKSLKQ